MNFSREAKLVSGILLLAVPTVMYGGITLLGLLTNGSAGIAPGELSLTENQWSLWRAGHAHAGVWIILSLIIQVLADASKLSKGMRMAGAIECARSCSCYLGRFLWACLYANISVDALLRGVLFGDFDGDYRRWIATESAPARSNVLNCERNISINNFMDPLENLPLQQLFLW